ncbi:MULTISPECIES: HNH endonuclease signature motif containing protein [unclassified Klebsiella]|uniref:HNH endonuclease signature motif containing protein n=1 Tax=unclassified Klebsiella TaxID=2608929 RepID=UPI001BAE27EC|nr:MULTISPECIES: HNH endonuclease signature motif containing protein [unclassified Klebsiella]
MRQRFISKKVNAIPNDPKKEDIEKFFECDPENGLIKRAINSGVAKAGEVPVSINNCGYHMVCALGRIVGLHRIMWIVANGQIPEGMEIDHINGDKGDNRIANLRLCTINQNRQNKPKYKNNKSGFKGVCFESGEREKPWRARIVVNKKAISLGNFHTKLEAHHAYQEAAKKYFGEFNRN